jgi:hypothetical protein
MTASQARKSARRVCCLSIGHGRARSDMKLSSQIDRKFVAFDAICRSSISRLAVSRLATSPRSKSHTVSAALKSP